MNASTDNLAVILMGHGSRVPGADDGMEQVAARLREAQGYRIVETCAMSLLGPRLRETLLKCVSRGATTVVVIPYFLHVGVHVGSDIPQIIQETAAEFPQVRVVLGGHLGYDDCLAELVQKRIVESEAREAAGAGEADATAERNEHG
jgi:sirohydrochlorin ferrochelatase